MTEPVLGLVLAGGLARRMGGGDKARIRIGGKTILERVLARLAPQCTRDHHQRQRRSRAFRRYRPAGGAGFGAGFRRPARRHPRRARLGGGACARDRRYRERAGRLSVPARRPGGAPARRRAKRPRCRSPAHAPANGAIPWSGCGRWRLRDDLRRALVEEASAQDRDLDRAPRRRHRRLAGDALRPLLQRQHAGGRRRGRAHCSAAMRPLSRLIRDRRQSINAVD